MLSAIRRCIVGGRVSGLSDDPLYTFEEAKNNRLVTVIPVRKVLHQYVVTRSAYEEQEK
ncbi:hypothetical protein PROFUN_07389 [Planoprotostelium fungivorum]|uniref:Uncharacterized protein n=1 Tax=Planoprotostelium fungivorum TaxID=1890364 RepID=A0A2P6MTK6_9EUKA|nr:hypothetical protein PROFUN_07389 [Planoprotostelium fungivorum]